MDVTSFGPIFFQHLPHSFIRFLWVLHNFTISSQISQHIHNAEDRKNGEKWQIFFFSFDDSINKLCLYYYIFIVITSLLHKLKEITSEINLFLFCCQLNARKVVGTD